MDTTTQFVDNEQQEGQSLNIKELAIICLANWRWFLFSIFVCLFIAGLYVMRTHPTYTRDMQVLIKEDAKGRNVATDVAQTFSQMGLGVTHTNVDNEMIVFTSPDLLFAVTKRLHLEVEYRRDGLFYDRVIYGDELPFTVSFDDLGNRDVATMTAMPADDGSIILTDFFCQRLKATAPVESNDKIKVKPGQTVKTPIGKITVNKPIYSGYPEFAKNIYITRNSIYSAANGLKARLTTSIENKQSSVINITLTDANIQRAEETLNTITNVYNEIWIEDKNQITTSTNEFINERLRVIEGELGNVDSNISSFKSNNMLPDLEATAQENLRMSSDAQKDILQRQTELSVARYIYNYVHNNSNNLIPANSGITDPGIASQISEYNNLQLQRNRLVEGSSDDNLMVKDMDVQLKALRASVLNSINNYIVATNAQLGSAQTALARADSRISSNPRQAGQLLSVERQQKVKEALYLFLLQKREENELSKAFTAYNTRVISTPGYGGSYLPTAPRRGMIMLVALIIGLIIPCGIIYLHEINNTTIRGRKDIEDITAPFLGEVPLTYQGHHVRRKSTVEEIIDKLLSLLRIRKEKKVENPASSIVVKEKSRNVVNEAFRVIRTNIEFMANKENGAYVMMTSSSFSGSGKTFIAGNLCAVLAIKGKKTLLLDLDLRKATASAYVGSPKTGISSYLGGQIDDFESLIKHTETKNFDVLPVGTLPPNPSELLASPRLALLLEKMRQKYDFIILDCPPVEIVTDADIINPLADTTLFVIRAGLFDRSMLPVLERYYKNQKYKNICVILNGTYSSSGYGYHRYGYGKYGSYGYGRYGYGKYGTYGSAYGSAYGSTDDEDEKKESKKK